MQDHNSSSIKLIRGVVFDWAGTIVDFGSLAPMGAFVELFARHGVTISIADARVPMGLPKLEHIKVLGAMEHIARQWQNSRGQAFSEQDAYELLTEFEPMSAQSALTNSRLIDGFLPTLDYLKASNIAVATTTGYTRRIMTPVIEAAAVQGFVAPFVICCDDVAQSRPDPMGMIACMKHMGVWPHANSVVKVDDTVPGLQEGLNAGCWTVGVAASGNALGWTAQAWNEADESCRRIAIEPAKSLLLLGGAHEVIDSVADLPMALARIERRIEKGESPC
jgi:phosphonoacetaldehyde hydrolase